jgi:hypothetical protein
MLLKTGQKKYLTQSIGYWKDILLSEKFWPHFEKLYALNDEIGTSKSALDDFAKQATDHLPTNPSTGSIRLPRWAATARMRR